MWQMFRQILRVGLVTEAPPAPDDALVQGTLHGDIRRIFGRALCIRHVDAGSCNGCELEIHALNNPYYNLEGQGVRFVASPRHADALLVTGPVSRHMNSLPIPRAKTSAPTKRTAAAVIVSARCASALCSTGR